MKVIKGSSRAKALTPSISPGLQRALFLCFVLSGMAGLVYEIIWTRRLTLIFGTTVYSVSTVLTTFMAGLALGSLLLGRFADRHPHPLRLYALLELGIGLYALLTPALFDGLSQVQVALFRLFPADFSSFSLVRFALSFSTLLIPTTLMGGTLPVMSRFLVERKGELGQKVGDLYFLNTIGAVMGSLLTGFLLLSLLGIRNTIVLAATVNLAVGVGVLFLTRGMAPVGKRVEERSGKREPPHESLSRGQTLVLLIGFGLAGFAALALEVAWTRTLTMVLGSSIYSFSVMLAAFLFGIAWGSFLIARIIDRQRNLWPWFALIEIVLGISVVALTPLFERLPFLFLGAFTLSAGSFWFLQAAAITMAFMVMLVPTLLMGAAFPIACKLYTKSIGQTGRFIGDVYFINTLGALLGSLVCGFLLIPLVGLHKSILIASLLYIIVGASALWVSPTWRWIARGTVTALAVAFVGIAIFMPSWNRSLLSSGVYAYAADLVLQGEMENVRERLTAGEQLFYKEGLSATVAVSKTGNTLSLRINGKADASTAGPDMDTQLLLGHLPLLLHNNPRKALVVGLGSGITLGAVLRYPVERVDAVEIEPAVAEAATFFSSYNHNALSDPRVRLITGDARNYMLATDEKYDVITAEPSNPWITGVSNLFTQEQYQLYRKRLSQGGLMLQWIHAYHMDNSDLRMAISTFRSVFPNTIVWGNFWSRDLLLVGAQSKVEIDFGQWMTRIAGEQVKGDLARGYLDDPFTILSYFIMDEETAQQFANKASLHTDDRPRLEISAPKSLYIQTDAENLRQIKEIRRQVYPLLRNVGEDTAYQKEVQEKLQQYSNAREHVIQGEIYNVQGRGRDGIAEFEKALTLNPGDSQARYYTADVSFLVARGYQQRGDNEKALELYRKSIDMNPPFLPARRKIAQIYSETQRIDEAIKELENVVQIESNDAQNRALLGYHYLLAERLDEAEAELKKATQLDARNVIAHNTLASLYGAKGMNGEAVAELEASLRIDPDQPEVREALRELRSKAP
ncbi:MAG: fused MFS/spermidine synthase [Chloroflexi bacterium]|nr:fused MFS/spermidine synthase [Chloroflexota bacterium]